MAAPAMRITVLDLFFGQQCTVRFQHLGDHGIGLPNRFSDDLVRQPSSGAFSVIELSGCIHRAVNRQPVLHADFKIFLAMARSGMNRARSLLERNVVGENTKRIAIEKWMAKNSAFDLR